MIVQTDQENEARPRSAAEGLHFRVALPGDAAALRGLIEGAFRTLGAAAYDEEQVRQALSDGVIGFDARLIDDGTYFVAEAADGEIVGCGGWSFRRQAFGGSGRHAPKVEVLGLTGPPVAPAAETLDPARDAAWMRAFFVHPGWVRRGIGRRLLAMSEAGARDAGFRRVELLATHTGAPLYLSCGYQVLAEASSRLSGGALMTGYRMGKDFG
jgi:GNAT superfamily N-acetyltransferase